MSDSGGQLAGLRIDAAKSGPDQFATLKDAEACQLLAALHHARTLKGDTRLFSALYPHILRTLRTAVSSLGIDASRFGTHSCRIGGLLSLSLRGVDSAAIALWKRWACLKSMEHYVKEKKANLLRMRLSSKNHSAM